MKSTLDSIREKYHTWTEVKKRKDTANYRLGIAEFRNPFYEKRNEG